MTESRPPENDQAPFIFRVVVVTLAAVILSVVLIMLVGLFDQRVDNKEVFAIIGPAFQTTIGCFVGVLGGRALGKMGA